MTQTPQTPKKRRKKKKKPQRRRDPELKKAQVRAANRAKAKAVNLLIAERQPRFDFLYAREAAAEGVTPAGSNQWTETHLSEADRLRSELAWLQELLEVVTREVSYSGSRWTEADLETVAREDLTVQEIAEMLHRSVDAVYVKRSRIEKDGGGDAA